MLKSDIQDKVMTAQNFRTSMRNSVLAQPQQCPELHQGTEFLLSLLISPVIMLPYLIPCITLAKESLVNLVSLRGR